MVSILIFEAWSVWTCLTYGLYIQYLNFTRLHRAVDPDQSTARLRTYMLNSPSKPFFGSPELHVAALQRRAVAVNTTTADAATPIDDVHARVVHL